MPQQRQQVARPRRQTRGIHGRLQCARLVQNEISNSFCRIDQCKITLESIGEIYIFSETLCVVGRESSKLKWLTRMGKNGHVSIQGRHSGDLGYKSKFYCTHQPCPHSGWTWKEHVGSKNKTNRIAKSTKTNIPASFGTKDRFSQKSTQTNMTAVARSIDIKSRWTHFHLKLR